MNTTEMTASPATACGPNQHKEFCSEGVTPEQKSSPKYNNEESILETNEYAKLREAAKAIDLNNSELKDLITSHEKARTKEALLAMLIDDWVKLQKETTGEVVYILTNFYQAALANR